MYFVECVSKIKHILSFIHYTIYGAVFSVYPFPLWWLREYIYFVSLSSSNRKYELLPIVYGYVMKQWCALYVFLYSYKVIMSLPFNLIIYRFIFRFIYGNLDYFSGFTAMGAVCHTIWYICCSLVCSSHWKQISYDYKFIMIKIAQ